MSVEYFDFWDGFRPDFGFFQRLTSESLRREVDLDLVSVFPRAGRLGRVTGRLGINQNRYRAGAKRIWYTGENKRPPYHSGFDGFLSFDQDDFGGQNYYLPLAHVSLLDHNGDGSGRTKAAFTLDGLSKPRTSTASEKMKFMCAFISNPEPTRLRALDEFSKIGTVDIFGPLVGRPIGDKAVVARDYKYMLCFENDIFPGYVTEKLVEAYTAGCVPIYWGDLGSEQHINRSSLLNLLSYQSIKEMVEHVESLDEAEFSEVWQEPLLKSQPSIDPLFDFLFQQI